MCMPNKLKYFITKAKTTKKARERHYNSDNNNNSRVSKRLRRQQRQQQQQQRSLSFVTLFVYVCVCYGRRLAHTHTLTDTVEPWTGKPWKLNCNLYIYALRFFIIVSPVSLYTKDTFLDWQNKDENRKGVGLLWGRIYYICIYIEGKVAGLMHCKLIAFKNASTYANLHKTWQPWAGAGIYIEIIAPHNGQVNFIIFSSPPPAFSPLHYPLTINWHL